MARRRITGQLKLFLEVLYTKHKGVSWKAAEEALYPNPIIDGPRLRRKYSDLCERARIAWVDVAHVTYDEALELLGGVAKNPEHREQVRAITTILELQGARQQHDPAALRREVTNLLKQLQIQRTPQPLLLEAEIIEPNPKQ